MEMRQANEPKHKKYQIKTPTQLNFYFSVRAQKKIMIIFMF